MACKNYTSISDPLKDIGCDKNTAFSRAVSSQTGEGSKKKETPMTDMRRNLKRPLTRNTTKVTGNGANMTKLTGKILEETLDCKSTDKIKDKKLSFLKSLSACPASLCDPKAIGYKYYFKTRKNDLAAYLYRLYNANIFDNKLPRFLKIVWNSRLLSTAGICRNIYTGKEKKRKSIIQLSTKVCTSADRVRDTLIHELCHAALWIFNGVKKGHGNDWRQWTIKAMARFPELPKIRVRHSYKIRTAYSYKCRRCGFSFGRHSKSLNLEISRCGYCYGEFDLESKKKSPTGFALFVKENFKKTKQKYSHLSHQEIWKILVRQYSLQKEGTRTSEYGFVARSKRNVDMI